MLLEMCVDSVESAIAAERGGAQRIELCSDLLEGGITPSAGLMQSARRRAQLEISVMIRPRPGDFFYSELEFETMKDDIRAAKTLGMNGIVVGLLDRDGRIEVNRTRELVELAYPLPVVFHRAVDVAPDFEEAVDGILASGARRILTAGGGRRAVDGIHRLAACVGKTQGRLTTMIGGGLTTENIRMVAESTGATEFHSGMSARLPSPVRYRSENLYFGVDMEREYTRYVVREEDVRSLREALNLAKPQLMR